MIASASRDDFQQLIARNLIVNDCLDGFRALNNLDSGRIDAIQQKDFEHYRLTTDQLGVTQITEFFRAPFRCW